MTGTPEQERQATAERLSFLRTRFAELRQLVTAGTATEEMILEEQELRARLQAAEQAAQNAQSRAHQAAIRLKGERWRADRDRLLTEVWTMVPYIRSLLYQLRLLEERALLGGEEGTGAQIEDLLGMPAGTAHRLAQAITEGLRGTPLGEQVFASDDELRLMGLCRQDVQPAVITTMPAPPMVYLNDPAFRQPPPGFSGVWNVLTGRPMDTE